MRILYDIVDDLYLFVLRTTERVCVFLLENATESDVPSLGAAARREEDRTPQVFESGESVEVAVPTFKRIDAIMRSHEHADGVLMYVAKQDAPLLKNPTVEFDGVLGTISYGAVVIGEEPQGRFMRVRANGKGGWMFRDDLTPDADSVYPCFVVGRPNGCDDENTVKLRACIKDAFAGGRVEYPLQAGEYVLYRLARRGVSIMWPDERPRTPGRWHVILRGAPGVRVSVVPKTGVIMEYMMNEGIGHVAHVDSVAPDGAIQLSEAHYPDNGTYNERMLDRDEWLALRPVFLEVS